MTGSCSHVGCRSGNNGDKTHLFTLSRNASSEVKQAWLRNIPKRNGRTFDPVKGRLCFKHFEERFIVKTSVVRMGGRVMVEEPRKCWTLTPDAVPTIFANHLVPAYYNRKAPTRKSPTKRNEVSETKRRKLREEVEDEVREASPWSLINDALHSLTLPNAQWKVYDGTGRDRIHVTEMDFTNPVLPVVSKHIQLLNDMSFKAYASGVDISGLVSLEGASVERVQQLITQVHEMKVCAGNEGYVMLSEEMVTSGSKRRGRWFSNQCELASHQRTCTPCVALLKNLKRARKKFDLLELMAARIRNTNKI